MNKNKLVPIVLAMAAPLGAYASTLPAVDFTNPLGLGAGAFTNPCGTDACAASFSQYYADGEGSISIVGAQSPIAQTNFYAHMTYSVEVEGPANISVPVDFTVKDSLSASSAYVSATDYFVFASVPQVTACTNGCNLSSVSGTYSALVTANDPFLVQIGAGVTLDPNSGAAQAMIDPSVVIDSSFNTRGYSIIFSPDASPLSPVPEPGSLWLMLSGLVGCGALTLRRRTAHGNWRAITTG